MSNRSILTPGRVVRSVSVLAAVGVAAAAVAIYVQREAIGVRWAVDYLRDQGVPAVIQLDRLGLDGAAGRVTVGPERDPDLSVGRVEVDFDPVPITSKGVGSPRVRAVRLIRPRLKARFDGRRFSFGALQPLVTRLGSTKGGGGPAPDVSISEGELHLTTPAGLLVVKIDGVIDRGRLQWVQTRSTPADFRLRNVLARAVDIRADARAVGVDRLVSDVHLTSSEVSTPWSGGRGLDVRAHAELPYITSPRLDGHVEFDARVAGDTLHMLGLQTEAATADLNFEGEARGALNALAAAGKGRLELQAARTSGRAFSVGVSDIELASSSLHVRTASNAVLSSGPLQYSVALGRAHANADGQGLALSSGQTNGQGEFAVGPGRFVANLKGGGKLDGGLSPSGAQRLAARILPPKMDAKADAAIARALARLSVAVPSYVIAADAGRLTVTLGAPARAGFDGGGLVLAPVARPLASASGATVSGGFDAALQIAGLPSAKLRADGYSLLLGPAPRLKADIVAEGEGSYGPVIDAALNLKGGVQAARDGVVFTATECAQARAGAVLSAGRSALQALSLTLCPNPGRPTLRIGDGGWRLAADLHGGAARSRDAALSVERLQAAVDLHGRGGVAEGAVRFANVDLTDLATTRRFQPIAVSGNATLNPAAWSGDLNLTLRDHKVKLGRLSLAAEPSGASGRAAFTSSPMAFAENGFQPSDISPSLAAALPQAQGVAAVDAVVAWSGRALATSGVLHAQGLDFRSPAGRIHGVRGDIHLSSLAPLVSAPAQQITADRLDTLLPLTALQATFALTPSQVQLASASATVADGRVSLDPMQLPLGAGPPPAIRSVVRIDRLDLAKLTSVLNLSNVMTIQARLDGSIPFAVDRTGLHLADGKLAADGPGRLTIQRQALNGGVATAGAAGAQPNAVQDFAYQALENLAFDGLDAQVQSRPGGRLGVIFHIKGRHDPPSAAPTRIRIVDLIRGHAFDKPIPLPKGTPVDLTLDTSLNLDELLAAYGQLNRSGGSAPVQP